MAVDKPAETPRWGSTVAGGITPNISVDGTSGQNSIEVPPSATQDVGWVPYLSKKTRQWSNWLAQRTYAYILYFLDQTSEHGEDAHGPALISGRVVTELSPPSLNAAISAGEVWIAGEKQTDPAVTSLAQPDASTNFIYVDTDRSVKTTVTAATAFATGTLPLTEVITAGGQITAITAIGIGHTAKRSRITVGPTGDFTGLASAIAYLSTFKSVNTTEAVTIVIDGTITVAATILINFPLRIVGADQGDAIIQWSNDGTCLDLISGANGTEISGVTFKFTGSSSPSSAVAIGNSTGNLLDVKVIGCHWLAGTNDAANFAIRIETRLERGTISKCSTDSAAVDTFVSFEGASTRDCQVEGCLLDMETTTTGTFRAINVESGSGGRITVRGCTINGGTEPIVVDAPGCKIVDTDVLNWNDHFAIKADTTEITIKGCRLTASNSTAREGGINLINASTPDIHNISDNLIDLDSTAGAGAGMEDAVGIKLGAYTVTASVLQLTSNTALRAIIHGNTVRNIGDASDFGIGIDAGAGSRVTDNHLQNIVGIGIRIDGNRTRVVGNIFKDVDPDSGGGVNRSAIYVDGGSGSVVNENQFEGYTPASGSVCIGFAPASSKGVARHNVSDEGRIFQADGVGAPFTGEIYAETTTSDGVQKVIWPIDLGLWEPEANTTYVFELIGSANEAATGDSAGWRTYAVYKTDGSKNLAIVGATEIEDKKNDGGASSWNMQIQVLVGGELEINVQGEVAHTIEWKMALRVLNQIGDNIGNY